jgi:hypothetical protein
MVLQIGETIVLQKMAIFRRIRENECFWDLTPGPKVPQHQGQFSAFFSHSAVTMTD